LEAFFILAHMKKTNIEELYKIYLKHSSLSKDSRNIPEASIYLALKGENFNGNTFADEALRKGAAYVVIDEEKVWKDNRYLLVDDVSESLQQLAHYHRKQLNIPIIAISGSNGKTTTKELIAAALSKKFNTLCTLGNYNNHIGVPLTLLRITQEHEMAIIEMGANHQGEIAFLCQITAPNFGMLTNIGKAHLEGFGGEAGVRKGKTEMFKYIDNNKGTLFINLDDSKIKASVPENVKFITYSVNEPAQYKGKLLETHPRLVGTWESSSESGEINSALYGAYNFHNILAACTIASHFGVEASEIDDAINTYESDMNRSQLVKKLGANIYLDAYNANPSSMSLSLDNFEKVQAEKKVAILGDMLELGDSTSVEHQNIIAQVQDCNSIDLCVFIGKYFSEHIYTNKKVAFFKTTEAAATWFRANKWDGFTLLLKGSRGMKLETILEN
jgi:UDP-N-acetylmuramoyl-tripeptide--D-alanyl-D-alanine ligase